MFYLFIEGMNFILDQYFTCIYLTFSLYNRVYRDIDYTDMVR